MKEGDSTEKLCFVESLVKELNCETVFTIPVFGGIAVDEGVVVTWIIMAVLTILSIVFVRNLSIEKPGKVQLMLESVIGWAQDFFEGIIGKEKQGLYSISDDGCTLSGNIKCHRTVRIQASDKGHERNNRTCRYEYVRDRVVRYP